MYDYRVNCNFWREGFNLYLKYKLQGFSVYKDEGLALQQVSNPLSTYTQSMLRSMNASKTNQKAMVSLYLLNIRTRQKQ